jgi:outer membrane immunogenic protein
MRVGRAGLLAIAAGLGAMSAALAADMPVKGSVYKAPAAVVAESWTGLYVGAQAGYQWNRDRFQDPAFGPPVISGTVRADGFVGGVHAGGNYQTGPVVLGVEGDIEWANASGDALGTDGTALPTNVIGHAKLKWQASVRGRIGYAFDRTLAYATGGVAFGRFDFGYTFPVVGGITDSFSKTLTGWTAGGGIEHAFMTRWSARLEYRYTDFGKASGTIINCCAAPPNAQDHDLTAHAVRAGLSYRFY